MSKPVRLAVIGTGLKAAEYARSWARMPEVEFIAVTDVSSASRGRFSEICTAAGRMAPLEFDDFRTMLVQCKGNLDAVYISTPHAFHAEQALAVIHAGLDLFLEKPMVTTVAEAKALIDARSKTGNTVVIAFNGALSPLVRDTHSRAAGGEFGELISVSATIWEGWSSKYDGQWKQKPELSGGGFMFDTGAHMMNTVCLLVRSEFERVSAYMNDYGKPIDITCAVAARLQNGALVTFNAAGEGPPGCASHMTFFYKKAIVRIDAWGAWREIEMDGKPAIREVAEAAHQENPLKSFLSVRCGEEENPSTVENGLRFARLWDAIKASAARDGESIKISEMG
ncbi:MULTISPECIES: Gfo/Idh/MocA family oxidoreductase [unclassified Rhizobium]|uniref:Gfo/Idh/MocA family protein n=1 Tax=unclassified Rhizobium TaxID=2613769 RepID=UPI000646DD8D|nr:MULTISPECIES: Gfo/Idh/MocA family oxidoreductase [unclassified Rhizobium]MBN8950566.1 Gfo/Idh/MocA family oxidoreductase [Rhizobium tropici]OJY66555.1 MAG: oxidoreductase [Rhizobium sp. 60-20]RKD69336.1 putative dehydrogenase [Rhizobium sp. WW_1]